MSKPLISIFMPTYNAEKYVEEAIDSALAQDYPNIEVVISDDASTDTTPQILKTYQEKFPEKIKLFLQQKNLGVTKNCNFILEKCSGDYVCFFAGDDVLISNCISEQHKLCIGNNVSIVFHNQILINEHGVDLEKHTQLAAHKGSLRDFLKKGIYTRANGMLISKKAIPKTGYDESQHIASDFDFILRVLNTKNFFYYSDQKLSKYRKHSLSITATDHLSCRLDNLKAYLNVMVNYPSHARYVKGATSRYYLGMRHLQIDDMNYFEWLLSAISYNVFNYKAWLGILVYLVTFKRVCL